MGADQSVALDLEFPRQHKFHQWRDQVNADAVVYSINRAIDPETDTLTFLV